MSVNVQHNPMSAVVVDVDVVLGRRAELASIFLPVVDGLRERHDDALKDRLTTACLSHPTVWHRDLRSDCTRRTQRCGESGDKDSVEITRPLKGGRQL